MKKKIALFFAALFLIPTALVAANARKGGGDPVYILDGDAPPYLYSLLVGSNSATALPSNTFTDEQKVYTRTHLIQNPNQNALYISTMSDFVPKVNPASLIPGSTGSMTLNNNATYYVRYGQGVSSDTISGMITRITGW